MLLESVIRKFLFEDIRVVFTDSPARIQDLARSVNGTAFRVKIKDTVKPPTVDDLLTRVRQNTQFGQSSMYANATYTYIMGADLRNSENNIVVDFIIGNSAVVQKKYGTLPTSTDKIGQADVYRDETLSDISGKLGKLLTAVKATGATLLGTDTDKPDSGTASEKPTLTSVSGKPSAVTEPAKPTAPAITTQTDTNLIGGIKIPERGFKYGVKSDELKKLQLIFKKQLETATIPGTSIKFRDQFAVKNFIAAADQYGNYGDKTKKLIAFLKGGFEFKNTDGETIEKDFVKRFFNEFKLAEQVGGFNLDAAEQAVQQQDRVVTPSVNKTPANTDNQDNTTPANTDTDTNREADTKKPDNATTMSKQIQTITKNAAGDRAKESFLKTAPSTWVEAWYQAILKSQSGKNVTVFDWGGKIYTVFDGTWTKYKTDIIGQKVYGIDRNVKRFSRPDWQADNEIITYKNNEYIGDIQAVSFNDTEDSLWFYIKPKTAKLVKYTDFKNTSKYFWYSHRSNFRIGDGSYTRPYKSFSQINKQKNLKSYKK